MSKKILTSVAALNKAAEDVGMVDWLYDDISFVSYESLRVIYEHYTFDEFIDMLTDFGVEPTDDVFTFDIGEEFGKEIVRGYTWEEATDLIRSYDRRGILA